MPSHSSADRCNYRDVSGRRCRLPRKPTHPHFCAHHARLSPDGVLEDPQAIVAEVLGSSPDFADARAVNQSLGKLIALFLGGRIPARHAAVAGYLFQLVIQTHPQIERQERPAAHSAPFSFITHIPRPDYSKLNSPAPDQQGEPKSGVETARARELPQV
jgi:hypothetical protein